MRASCPVPKRKLRVVYYLLKIPKQIKILSLHCPDKEVCFFFYLLFLFFCFLFLFFFFFWGGGGGVGGS